MVGAADPADPADAGVDADFEIGDAMAPPWPSETFDVVLSRHVAWALPDRERGLGRWFELLKPGGRLVLIEGRWWTGAGLGADELEALSDAGLWGGSDERYLLVSPADGP